MIAAGWPHPNLAPRQIVDTSHLRRLRSGDQHFLHSGQPRPHEVDMLAALGRHREIRRDDVAFAFAQAFDQLVARRRHQHDIELVRLCRVALVQPFLQFERGLGGGAAHHALVLEEQRAARRHQHADQPAMLHAIEIVTPYMTFRKRQQPNLIAFRAGRIFRRRILWSLRLRGLQGYGVQNRP